MRTSTKIILAVVVIAVVFAGAVLGGLLGILPPSPTAVRAWSNEPTNPTQDPFPTSGLSQSFVPTTSVSEVTSVYALLHSASDRYGTYLLVWSINCNGESGNGGNGQVVWDTTTVIQAWVPMPTTNAGNVSVGDNCVLFVHVSPLEKKGGTGELASTDIKWMKGADGVHGTIVWGTAKASAVPTPAGPTIKSITTVVNGLVANFAADVAGGMTPYTYDWNFGDGSPHSSAAAPSHTYPSNGTYKAVLAVSDASGGAASQTKSVSVVPGVSQSNTTYYNPAVGSLNFFIGVALAGAGAVVVGLALMRKKLLFVAIGAALILVGLLFVFGVL